MLLDSYKVELEQALQVANDKLELALVVVQHQLRAYGTQRLLLVAVLLPMIIVLLHVLLQVRLAIVKRILSLRVVVKVFMMHDAKMSLHHHVTGAVIVDGAM
jgi:hypothetical protein